MYNFDKSSDCCIVLCRNISFLRWSRTDEKWDNGKRTHVYTHERKSINAISFTSVVRRRASENSSGTTIAQVSDYNLKAIMSFLRDVCHICFVPFKSKSPRYTYLVYFVLQMHILFPMCNFTRLWLSFLLSTSLLFTYLFYKTKNN